VGGSSRAMGRGLSRNGRRIIYYSVKCQDCLSRPEAYIVKCFDQIWVAARAATLLSLPLGGRIRLA
jgi:hypothetical protein